jgi:hypothetical protein
MAISIPIPILNLNLHETRKLLVQFKPGPIYTLTATNTNMAAGIAIEMAAD